MPIDKEYEKQFTEIQSLKKAVNNEKVAHQTTIDQLQNSCILNQQLQTFIKQQTNRINQLSKQLADKAAKLQEMSVGYESQLTELKQFVFAKDRELQSIRGTLSVCDYDMIRLRAINELQVGHNEQLEERNREIQRLNKLWELQKQQKSILSDKLEHTKKELQKQTDASKAELEERQKVHSKENSKLREKLENERLAKKELEKLLQTTKQRYQQMLSKTELSVDKESADNKLQHFRNEFDDESQNIKIRKLEENIAERNREIEGLKWKMEKQETRSQQTISDLQKELKEAKHGSLNCEDLLNRIKEKQTQIEEISNNYERKLRNQRDEFSEAEKKLRREHQRRIEQVREKAKTMKEKENCTADVFNVQQTQKVYENWQNREIQRMLQEKVKLLQQKNAELTKQSRNQYKRTERIVSLRENGGQQIGREGLLRAKLDQANLQIVTLLKEKVVLKREINQLKH